MTLTQHPDKVNEKDISNKNLSVATIPASEPSGLQFVINRLPIFYYVFVFNLCYYRQRIVGNRPHRSMGNNGVGTNQLRRRKQHLTHAIIDFGNN